MEDSTKKKLKTTDAKATRTLTFDSSNDSLIHGQTNDFVGGSKVAMFDMDGNLIKTKSGKTHAKGAADWVWWHDCVPAKLREYHDKGYVLAIATNQSGISSGTTNKNDIMNKIKELVKIIDRPFSVMIAGCKDGNRKPNTGMWDFFRDNYNDGIAIDLKQSCYVGDAAGRPANGTKRPKRDHGYGDRCMAVNVGTNFFTPEMFFLGEAESLQDLPPLPKSVSETFPNRNSIFVCAEYVINPDNKHGK
jgi:bifunctional polynucleotide phosphatase/kinase